MTAPRAKVDAALAVRGWQPPWATEQEAARLAGVTLATYRSKLKDWESLGFPKKHPLNGKRYIPGILAFFGLPTNHLAAASPPAADSAPEREPTTEELENFDDGQGQRKAS